jgi:hypothetical protein
LILVEHCATHNKGSKRGQFYKSIHNKRTLRRDGVALTLKITK